MRSPEISWQLGCWIGPFLNRCKSMLCYDEWKQWAGRPFRPEPYSCTFPQGVRMAKFRAERAPTRKVPHTRATDRGYAWLVLFVCVMIDMIYSSSYMVGIFLVEFKHHFGVSATMVSWVGGLQHSVGKIAGKCRLGMKDSSETIISMEIL